MKWYAISGSWRKASARVRKDVESAVFRIIKAGDGIITGGAPGVDYFANRAVIEKGNPKKQLKVFLPIQAGLMIRHYKRRARESILDKKAAKEVVAQILLLKKKYPGCIHDKTRFRIADKKSYYTRNTTILKNCDQLYAFHVNRTQGTQDAIDKAKKMGKKAIVKRYAV